MSRPSHEELKAILESKYAKGGNRHKEGRHARAQSLAQRMDQMQLDPEQRTRAEEQARAHETEHLRLARQKMSVDNFEMLDIIGRGAFGEVRICRERATGEVYAIKKLRKSDMVS